MKNLKRVFVFLVSLLVLISCQKEKESKPISTVDQSSRLKYTLVDVIPANSLSLFGTYWNNLYPWGSDHNGSARMRAQNISASGGVLTLTSYAGSVSGKPAIHYFSGTIHAKTLVKVEDAWPLWRITGEFQCASVRGTWPAFWLTGYIQWPPESDIMEFKGSTTCWTNTYKNESGNWSSIGSVVSSPGNWHTYTIWMAKSSASNVKIEYWIDGVKKATHTGGGFMNQPMWLIIDYQMEGSSGAPGPTGTTYMKARNVRVQKSATL